MSKQFKENKNDSELTAILSKLTYGLLVIVLYLILILAIKNTSPFTLVNEYKEKDYSAYDELTANVGSFNTDEKSLNSNVKSFINEMFSTRNSAFLNGNVESLYNFFNIYNDNSRYSINYEFKRISYLRDWAIERGIIFTTITSEPILISIKEAGNKITVKVDEDCSFNYIYTDNPQENKFHVRLIHIITLNKVNDTFKIEKDYYLDFLNNDLNKYKFNLTEKTLPYTSTGDNKITTSTDFKIGDIISYSKYNFVDHRGVVSKFDSNGYPLIDSTTISTNNIPYDLGWKDKNIKRDN